MGLNQAVTVARKGTGYSPRVDIDPLGSQDQALGFTVAVGVVFFAGTLLLFFLRDAVVHVRVRLTRRGD